MAIYHLHVSVGNKSKGASALERFERLACSGSFKKERGELAVVRSEHLPSWAQSPRMFWKSVDIHERANGVVYREVEASLPRELDEVAQVELADAFAHELTHARQLPHTLSVFKGSGHNPRVHLMLCERGWDGLERGKQAWFKQANRIHPERGGAPKVRALREKSWLFDTRETWSRLTNLALERAGIQARIDHRSYKEQGIEKEPQIHLGAAVHAMKARGVQTERGELFDELEELRVEQERLIQHQKRLVVLEQLKLDMA
jgi:hypothetical protein